MRNVGSFSHFTEIWRQIDLPVNSKLNNAFLGENSLLILFHLILEEAFNICKVENFTYGFKAKISKKFILLGYQVFKYRSLVNNYVKCWFVSLVNWCSKILKKTRRFADAFNTWASLACSVVFLINNNGKTHHFSTIPKSK